MDTQDKTKFLNQRTDIIISLLIHILESKSKEFKTLRSKITFLYSFGLKSKEIGQILNKKDSHIRKEIAIVRKLNNKNN